VIEGPQAPARLNTEPSAARSPTHELFDAAYACLDSRLLRGLSEVDRQVFDE
jgi:hypothetical protein